MNITPESYELISPTFIDGYRFVDRIVKENNNHVFDLILDIGCGHGKITSYLAKKFNKSRIIAIDINNEMIKYAKENYNNENIDYNVVDITKPWDQLPDSIKLLKGKIDLVFSNWVFDFIKNREISITIENIYKLLKTTGKFYFNIPCSDIYPSDITNEEKAEMQKFIKMMDEDESKSAWEKAIIKSNLKIINIKNNYILKTVEVKSSLNHNFSDIEKCIPIWTQLIKHHIDEEDKDKIIKRFEDILVRGFFQNIYIKISENFYTFVVPICQIFGQKSD